MASLLRKPTAAELAELEGGSPTRAATPDELAELEGPHVGPYRDNPSFATAPPPAGVPNLPPREAVPPMRPQHTQGEAVLTGALGGGTLGFSDEAGAALAALGHHLPMTDNPEFGGVPGSLPQAEKERAAQPKKPFAQDYRDERDAARANDAEVRKDWPKTVLAGEVAGSVATGGAGAGRSALANIGRAAATGAAAGLGNSEADITRGDVGGAAWDTAKGGLLGGAVGAAGEGARGVAKLGRKVSAGTPDDLRARILNEVAEGTGKTTPTQRLHLDASGDAITKEIVHGPEGDAIRAAIGGSAKKGAKVVTEAANRVTAENNTAYGAFDAAGRNKVDAKAYRDGLQAAADKARAAGKSMVADAIEKFGDHVVDEGQKTGGLTLTQLRGLTTQAQTKVEGMLGGLNSMSIARKTGKQVVRAITPAMKDTLNGLASGSPDLEKAATTILDNNERLTALLPAAKALQIRATQESSMAPLLVRGAKAIALPAALGATGGALTSDDKVEGALKGAAIGGLLRYGIPAAATKLNRVHTSAMINAARNAPGTAGPAMTRAAGLLGRIGGGMIVGKKHDDDEETP